jgi:hypothetical protein
MMDSISIVSKSASGTFSLEATHEKDYDSWRLAIEHGGTKIKFEPENYDGIKRYDPQFRSEGMVSFCTWDGQVTISWKPTEIEVAFAKYGDSEGGSLTVKIPSTDVLDHELYDILLAWKEDCIKHNAN